MATVDTMSMPFSSGQHFGSTQQTYTSNTNVDPITHTTSPIVTGSSVLAIKYADGVMIMADTLGSYGSMAMFKQVERIRKITDNTIIAAGGEYSDLQEISRHLEALTTADAVSDDDHSLSTSELYSYVHRWLYQRRTKMNPLWNSVVVAGINANVTSASNTSSNSHSNSNAGNQDFFLGAVDLYGNHYQDNVIGTGYGAHLGLPLLRKSYSPDLTQQQAQQLLESTMRVLLYRDCRTINSFQVATITKAAGVVISEPFKLQEQKWEFKRMVNPDNVQ